MLENNYSLNTVDICPVGALTSTDFRFKMRVWFLKKTNSICTESSVGANTVVWSREGKIYRITPRRNDAVNDTWMTDSGRALFKAIESDDRLTHYTIEGVHKTVGETAEAAAELLKSGKVAVVGSAHSSVEEQFFHRLIADHSKADVFMVSKQGEGDGILLSEDRTPNLRGALLNGLITELPEPNLDSLASRIKAGEIDTLFVVNEDISQVGISDELLSKVKIVYLGTHASQTSQVASIVFPTLSVFEKDGSFVNQSFRLQKFNAAVPGPSGVQPDILVLEEIVAHLAAEKLTRPSISSVWDHVAAKVGHFSGLTWQGIGEEGVELDPLPFLDLPFAETKNLKFDPVKFKEAHIAPVEA